MKRGQAVAVVMASLSISLACAVALAAEQGKGKEKAKVWELNTTITAVNMDKSTLQVEVEVEGQKAKAVEVVVKPETKITVGGKKARLADLKPKQIAFVEAIYLQKEKHYEARSITDGVKQTVLEVEMDCPCGGCAAGLSKAWRKLDGVMSSKVYFKAKPILAKVLHEPTKVDAAALVKAGNNSGCGTCKSPKEKQTEKSQ